MEVLRAFAKALELIVTLDPEVVEIAGRSLRISLTSCGVASALCLPLGCLIHFSDFRGKRVLINLIQTLYALPTVVVGLLVFLLLSRRGPLGGWGLLFTPTAMVMGQVIIISPILTGLVLSALSGVGREVYDTALSLGANRLQGALVVVREARYSVMAAVIMGFGRAISEVGCSLMVGGNIRGFTRILTTAISLETTKGNVELSLALGIILLGLALSVNMVMNILQGKYGWR